MMHERVHFWQMTLAFGWMISVAAIASAETTLPASRPARILPQNQQVLLYFGVYGVAADAIEADAKISAELHQKVLDRIATGRADAEAMLAKASPPEEGAAGIQQGAKLSQDVSSRTRACVADLRKLLDRGQYQAFDERAKITMEEVLSLQVVKADTDYVHRDILGQLGLSGDQQKREDAQLKANHEQMQKLMKQYVYRAGDGRGTYLSTEAAFETRRALREILTPEQAKRWDDAILKKVGG